MQSATLRDVRTGLDEVQAGRDPARARRGEGSLLRDGPYANGCVEPVSCEFEPSLRRQARILEIGYQRPATASSVLRSSTFRRTRSRRSHWGPPSATSTAASAGSRRWSARTGPRGVVQKVSNLILNINVYMEDAESGTMSSPGASTFAATPTNPGDGGSIICCAIICCANPDLSRFAQRAGPTGALTTLKFELKRMMAECSSPDHMAATRPTRPGGPL